MNVRIVKHEHVIIIHSIESNTIEMHNFQPHIQSFKAIGHVLF